MAPTVKHTEKSYYQPQIILGTKEVPQEYLQQVSAIYVLHVSPIGQHIGVEQIQELIHWADTKPHVSQPYKLAVVHDAERTNPTAQAKLLKLLEEPPPDTRILLLCSQISQIMPTVRSRCLVTLHESATQDESTALNTQLAKDFLKANTLQRLTFAQKILEEYPDRYQQRQLILQIMQMILADYTPTTQSLRTLDILQSAYIGLEVGTLPKLTWESLAISMEI